MSGLRFLVVGDPVDHSLSPRIHRAALRWNHIAGAYGRRTARPEDLRAIRSELLEGRVHGVNVTMPNKRAAFEVADRRTAEADRAGSVNTLWVRDGEVHGDTTDVEGIRWAWRHGALPADGRVVIAGSGGAAAAALLALEGRPLAIAARRSERAAQLVDATRVAAEVLPWGAPVGPATVVNATPIGMHGEELPGWLVDEAAGLLDMTYGATASPGVVGLRERGRPAIDGSLMLVGQAARSFAIWTGVNPPHAVMLAALSSTQSDQ